MTAQDTGLRASIKNASQLVQDTASKSEAAALDAVARAETALASAQSTLTSAREFGSEVAGSIGHAGRTSLNGVVEFNNAVGRYGKHALTDTIEVGPWRLFVESMAIDEEALPEASPPECRIEVAGGASHLADGETLIGSAAHCGLRLPASTRAGLSPRLCRGGTRR